MVLTTVLISFFGVNLLFSSVYQQIKCLGDTWQIGPSAVFGIKWLYAGKDKSSLSSSASVTGVPAKRFLDKLHVSKAQQPAASASGSVFTEPQSHIRIM